ncbi:hypothetical protein [Limnobacter litoralis]|uniref:Uncharacterized protein n=1 Tax=Limnobacter litoralis TaxID=481366 RepID=A0ABQ5YRX5_9BURK|nr:hypothetical protein [Limnobacter litoralis]GLR26530.1 hypothetical protein GCM10007875_16200 [Limnobacter litoralis]
MQIEMPFFECPEDALKSAVQALGGAKAVGQMIWPDKSVDAAARLLLDCLNPSRAEKLDVSQVILVFTRARAAGHHTPFLWFAQEVGYEAKPVTKEEEVDRLTFVIENSTKQLEAALGHLAKLRAGG